MTDASTQYTIRVPKSTITQTTHWPEAVSRTSFLSGPKSIRGRLQWWYGAVYAISIIVFGGLVYWRADRDVVERATLQVVSTAQYLDVSLRTIRPDAFRERGEMRQPDQGRRDPFPREFTFGPLPPEFQFRPPRDPEPGRRPPERLPHAGDGGREVPDGPPGPRGSEGRGGPVRPGGAEGPERRQRPPQRDLLDTLRPPGFGIPPRDDSDRPPVDRMEFVIWKPDGMVLTRSAGESNDEYVNSPAPDIPGTGPQITRSRGTIQSLAIQTLVRGPHGTKILVHRSLAHDIANLHRFGFQIAGMGGLTLVVGIVGGWWISGRLVQPIQMISTTASQISAANLHRRIETHLLDQELIQLASVLNGTFERLEQSFGRLTQFTADASHELRTPLAVIQSQVELALSQPRSTESYQQTLLTCLNSAERMRSLIDGLLLLARTDSDHRELRLERMDLRRVAEDAVAQLHEKAVSAGVDLQCSTPEEAVVVSGDSRFLAQIPANLIDNAIQHTPVGGTVRVEVRVEENAAVLSVVDTGCGVAAEHLPYLFERFYRVDVGRSRQHGGSGLGLAICRSLVEAHHGTISCESTVEEGCTFIVRLPLPGRLMAFDLENVNVT